MGFKVLRVEVTPNPNARKFVLDRVIAERPMSYLSADAAGGEGLAGELFGVEGVASLLFLGDFVTVNVRAGMEWKGVVAGVKRVLKRKDSV